MSILNIENMEKIIYQRHSTRNFDPEFSISRTDIVKILEAGCRAPSPKNRQPWSFTVLTEKKALFQVSEILKTQLQKLREERKIIQKGTDDLDMAIISAEIIRNCSALIFVNYNRDEQNEHGDSMQWSLTAQAFEVADIQAIGACIENMLLYAESNGISSLWICDVLYAEQALYDALHMTFPFIAAIAFGKASTIRTKRVELDEKVTWFSYE